MDRPVQAQEDALPPELEATVVEIAQRISDGTMEEVTGPRYSTAWEQVCQAKLLLTYRARLSTLKDERDILREGWHKLIATLENLPSVTFASDDKEREMFAKGVVLRVVRAALAGASAAPEKQLREDTGIAPRMACGCDPGTHSASLTEIAAHHSGNPWPIRDALLGASATQERCDKTFITVSQPFGVTTTHEHRCERLAGHEGSCGFVIPSAAPEGDTE